MPYLGVNAIDHIGDFIHAVNHRLKPTLATRNTTMPVEPPGSRYASININSVFGGQPEDGMQTPCVADRAGAIFDRRFLKEESFADVKAEVQRILEDLSGANPNFRYELQDVMIVHPTETDRTSNLVVDLTDSIGTVMGSEAQIMASPGTYDQKHVVRLGHVKNCVAYGPGKLDLAHQPDEYVTIEDLVSAAQVMALTTIKLLGTI
jgi:succinyl-diaminopimelate desuccinylase